MTNQRRSRPRNQKREQIRTAAMALVLMALWLAVAVVGCKVWAEHPAEQPISGAEYLQSIREGNHNAAD